MQPRPGIYGHRGAAGLAPENTLAGCRRALELGAEGLEVDIRCSQEGTPVLIHDPDLERTTDAQGPVDASSLERLQGCDAGAWFAPEFTGESIPTFAELLAICQPATRLILDPKSAGCAAPLARALAAAGRRWAGAPQQILACIWNPGQEAEFRLHLPEVQRAFLQRQPPARDALPGIARAGFQALSLNHQLIDAAYLDAAAAHGFSIYLWTVNESADLQRWMQHSAVDGLITDDPARALRLRP